MKRLIFIFSVFMALFLASCKKEVIRPNNVDCGDSAHSSTAIMRGSDNGGSDDESGNPGGSGITDPNDDEDIHKTGKGKK